MQYFKRAMHEGYQKSSVGKVQRLSCAESNPVIFRYDRSAVHHSVVVFRHDNSADHHINNKVGPFRHDGSAGRSQRVKESVYNGIMLNITPTTSTDHARTQGYTAPAAYSNMLLYQLARNSSEDVYKLKSAKTSNNQLTSKLIQLIV
ncbi:NBS-containing resistance-like protein [Dorcoceras hygrometricum]|uniref:NBS-containing resistance-like protein n=1 Tax=Dorcoceras hygrometricum TaxID=472368 RepID=A0A2Z7AN68_9LAMI|nr:NBS-containing resistance-like protein [Dorcoceras hygrometricum]